jgi:hypothetical protein
MVNAFNAYIYTPGMRSWKYPRIEELAVALSPDMLLFSARDLGFLHAIGMRGQYCAR